MHTRLLPAIVCGIVLLFLFTACGGPKTPDATAVSPTATVPQVIATITAEAKVTPIPQASVEPVAQAAFEAWAKTNGEPYRDVQVAVDTNDGYFAQVRVIAWFRAGADAPWEEREAAVACKLVGAAWQCGEQFAFTVTAGEMARQASAVATTIAPLVIAATATAVAAISLVETVDTRINPRDGSVYVYVPAGPFIMGSNAKDPLASDDEKPQMPDFGVDGFWIMQTEVTNAQYAKCVEAGACQEPDASSNSYWNDPAYAEYPVNVVDWYQANAYAQWAGGRLPTEAEWEKACRGTDGRIYPWGDESPTQALANFASSHGSLDMSVGSYPSGASPYGALDMAGSVREWTATKWVEDYQNYQPNNEPDGADHRTARGGAWLNDDQYVRCADRVDADPDGEYADFGFRVASSSE